MNIDRTLDGDLARIRDVARRMDALFRIPGTRITVGLDNILGLVPVAGDLLSVLPALWIVREARMLGARPATLARMMLNTLFDAVIGSVPLAGDLFDLLYNANLRNLALLEADVAARCLTARPARQAMDAPPRALTAG